MRIGLDAMGGDFAPVATVAGAVAACSQLDKDDKIVLFGDKAILEQELKKYNAPREALEIVHATQIVDMHDKPIKALKEKPDSGLSVGLRYLKQGKIDSFASAGNTGAVLVGAMYSIGMVQGFIRPALAAFIPKENGGMSVLVDVGANPDSKPDVLYQFGLVGSLYAKNVMGIDNPRVGLINIGEEAEKGNQQCLAAHQLMEQTSDFNFVGNMEPRELFRDNCEVFVCDGFVGNILLKNIEAMCRLFMKRHQDEFVARFNYEIYGGLPLLGANGVVIIGHGISSAKAIENMLLQSEKVYESQVIQKIQQAFLQTNHIE